MKGTKGKGAVNAPNSVDNHTGCGHSDMKGIAQNGGKTHSGSLYKGSHPNKMAKSTGKGVTPPNSAD